MSILITRFPVYLGNPDLQPQPLTVLTPMLSHPRAAVRKRAITTLAQFLPSTRTELFQELLSSKVFPGLTPSANVEDQRTTVQLVAAIARHTPHQIEPHLGEIVPALNKSLQREDEELQESALQVCYRCM